jgi:hypothetical protein
MIKTYNAILTLEPRAPERPTLYTPSQLMREMGRRLYASEWDYLSSKISDFIETLKTAKADAEGYQFALN